MNRHPSLRNHARAERQETMTGAPTGEVPPGGGLAIHHLLKLKAKRLISPIKAKRLISPISEQLNAQTGAGRGASSKKQGFCGRTT